MPSPDLCKALIPSASVRLSPDEEDRMVTFALNRLDYFRTRSGWTNGGNNYTRETWAWKRYVYSRMFEGDFKHRALPDSLFARVNLTLNMAAQFIEQHKSRITDDLLGAERFFGLVPEGPEDQSPILQDVEHVLHDTASGLSLQDRMKLAVQAALVRGEIVPKITRQVKRTTATVYARPMMVLGEVQKDTCGCIITDKDEWMAHPQNEARKILKRDPKVWLPHDAAPAFAETEIPLVITTAMHTGCDFVLPHWADLVIPTDATSLDAAELLTHCFMQSQPDLFDLMPEEAQSTPMAEAYLDATRGRPDGAERAEAGEAQENRGEFQRPQPDGDERAYCERRYDEIYFRYDWTGKGRFDHLVLLVDREARWPIYYGTPAEIMPWTSKHHPFREPIRIFPVEDRWYGRGYYERYGDSATFVDKCWCRIELELQKSGNLLIENRDATEEGRAGKPIKFRTPGTLKTSGSFRPEDVLHVITVAPQVAEIEQSMETMLQKMQSEAGVTSPTDAVNTGMDAANTLGGMQILEQQKSTSLREREGELITGINSALVGIAEVELYQPDINRIASLLESKPLPGVPLPQVVPMKPGTAPFQTDATNGLQPSQPSAPGAPPPQPPATIPQPPPLTGMERAERLVAWARVNAHDLSKVIKLYVTRSRQAHLFEQCTKILQIIDKWLGYGPDVRPNLYDTFADMLRALDVQDPERLLGPKTMPTLALPAPSPSPQPPAPNPVE